MEPKKISFGFSKTQKRSNILSAPPPRDESKVELIKCLEGQAIKLVEEKPVEEEKPLVIPLKESTRTTAALASLKARHDALNGITSSQPEEQDTADKPQPAFDKNETIEQKAARELLESVNKTGQAAENDTTAIEIPKPDELPLDGAKESSMDDYESTPIEKYGYAMLRGMGWKEDPKKKDDKNDLMEPFVRPKGMGLGADKIAKKKPPLIAPESNETLEVKRNACVRILAGKHKDLYGVIEGFDEHAGRVIVKLALGGHFESLNEFLVQPVSKKEYAQYGKVINSAKYEEYKKLENEHGQIVLKAPKIEKTSDSETEDRKPVVKQEKYATQATSSRRYSSDGDYQQRDHCNDKTRDRRDDQIRDRRDDRTRNRYEAQIRDRRDDNTRDRHRSDRHDRYDADRRRNNDTERQRSYSEESSPSESSDDQRHRVKKKSSKSKSKKKNKEQCRDRSRSRERRRHSRSRDSSSEDEKRHKKKTKKSKRPRSRSRERKR